MQPILPVNPPRCVRICQSRSCQKLGAKKVLAAFQAQPVANTEIVGCSCLGQCGNGPMAVILPDQVWYSSIHPKEVAIVIDRHLRRGEVVKSMLYSKFHPKR